MHQPAPARSNHPVVTIKLASTSDELLQCYALRAAVFMGEQQCPYWEEFDGNDYSASHLMLYVDGEPAASMRVRWFSGFAKLERAIILKRYRSLGLFVPFVEWAKRFAARLRSLIAHASTGWRRPHPSRTRRACTVGRKRASPDRKSEAILGSHSVRTSR